MDPGEGRTELSARGRKVRGREDGESADFPNTPRSLHAEAKEHCKNPNAVRSGAGLLLASGVLWAEPVPGRPSDPAQPGVSAPPDRGRRSC
jgi:hypothetical protein